METPTTVIAI